MKASLIRRRRQLARHLSELPVVNMVNAVNQVKEVSKPGAKTMKRDGLLLVLQGGCNMDAGVLQRD